MVYRLWATILWQATLFACLAALLTLALGKDRASLRYGIWLTASVKFLIPFSLLVGVGSQVEWRNAPAVPPPLTLAIEQIGEPFARAESVPATPGRRCVAFRAGAAGCRMVFRLRLVLLRWWVRWRRIRRAVRAASPLPMHAPIEVISSPTRLEPGVFGVFRPVLLVPEGVADRLTPAQWKAILAHELCHVRWPTSHRQENFFLRPPELRLWPFRSASAS